MKQTIGQRIRLALEINHMRQSDLSKKNRDQSLCHQPVYFGQF